MNLIITWIRIIFVNPAHLLKLIVSNVFLQLSVFNAKLVSMKILEHANPVIQTVMPANLLKTVLIVCKAIILKRLLGTLFVRNALMDAWLVMLQDIVLTVSTKDF